MKRIYTILVILILSFSSTSATDCWDYWGYWNYDECGTGDKDGGDENCGCLEDANECSGDAHWGHYEDMQDCEYEGIDECLELLSYELFIELDGCMLGLDICSDYCFGYY